MQTPFEQVRFDRTNFTTDIKDRFEEMEGQTVRLAGRMMSKRIMGKASFADLSDRYGRLQLYVTRDALGEDVYKGFKKMDIGDLIGIAGEVFRTQKGEISVKVTELTLLSKNLIPLPEKWHGLKDTDMRYRQRYVDLIINPEVRDTFEKRSAIVREIRRFMDGRGFMEVETPCLNTIPGGAAARPFITHHNALDIDMYMRIATELHLKRLIVGGLEQVYEIGRIFRNEGMDTRHNRSSPPSSCIRHTPTIRHDGHHRGYGRTCLREGSGNYQGHLPGHRAGLLQGLEAHDHGRRSQGVFRSGLHGNEPGRGTRSCQGTRSGDREEQGQLGRPAGTVLRRVC